MKAWAIALPLLALAACGETGSNTSSAPVAAVPPPAGTDWASTVAATPDGGFVMGNPNAPIKLVEYGSLSCSHCADFSAAASEALRTNYVASGKVSYEFRSFLLGGQDVAPTLLISCGGPGPFFTLLEQAYAQQKTWLGKLMAMSPAEQQRMAGLAPEQQFAATAAATGLDQFVRERGIAPAQAAKCLSDVAGAERLVAIRKKATDELKVNATPSFLINGQLVPETASWEALEPKLRAAGA